MIQDETYIMGFFNSPHFGVVDLNKMEYKKIDVFWMHKKTSSKKYHILDFGVWVKWNFYSSGWGQ